MYDWSKMFIDAAENITHQTFKIPRLSAQLIKEAGFVDVVERKFKIPVGPWVMDTRLKEIGRWNLLYLTTGLEGMQLWMLKYVLGVSFGFRWECWACVGDANDGIVGIARDPSHGS
jgi:hypothetical protein